MTITHFRNRVRAGDNFNGSNYFLFSMIHKLEYIGKRPDGQMQVLYLTVADALEKGLTFSDEDYEMVISENDRLTLLMHQHCGEIKIKLHPRHEYTIAELLKLCPAVLRDLLELNGGEEFLADIWNGYEELYNQHLIFEKWQETNRS